MSDAMIIGIVSAVVGAVFAAFFAIRYSEVSRKRKEFTNKYNTFSEIFTDLIECLNGNANLNYTMTTEFGNHKTAKDIFICNLKGRRLERFNQKWAEYEQEYYQANNLGVVGIGAAIAPSQEALAGATPDDPPNWESDRKKRIHCIIIELLKTSKVKIWF